MKVRIALKPDAPAMSFDCVVRVVRKQEQVHGMTDAQAEKIILQGQSCGTPHSGGEITLVCAKSFNQVVTLEVVVEVRLFFLQIGFELFKQVVAIAGLQVTDEVAISASSGGWDSFPSCSTIKRRSIS